MRKRLGREAARADSAVPAPTSAERVPPAGPISAAWRDPRSAPWTTASDVIIALAFFFLLCIGRSDSAPWLIEDEQLGLAGQRQSDAEALLHTQ